MGIMAPVYFALVSFLLIPAINGQFDRDLLAKCNNGLDTVCLSINTLLNVTYQTNECFPTTGNSSYCYGMIVGQLDKLNKKIDWIFYTNERYSRTRIMTIPRPLKPVQILYYIPELDRYQPGTGIAPGIRTKADKLFQKVQSVPKWNITSHRYFTFTSGFRVMFSDQNEEDKESEFIETDLLVDSAYFSINFYGFFFQTEKPMKLFTMKFLTTRTVATESTTRSTSKSTKGWIIGLIVLGIILVLMITAVVILVLRERRVKDFAALSEPLNKRRNTIPGFNTFSTVKTLDSKDLIVPKHKSSVAKQPN